MTSWCLESSIYGMYGHAVPATLGWTCHQNVTKPFASTPSLLWASGRPSLPWWPDETFFRQRQATAEEMPDTARISRHSSLIDLCGVTSLKMVLPHSLSTTIRRQKLAGFVVTTSPRRRQPAHASTSVTESVPLISDCAVIYASTIVHPQLASTASLSTSTDSYKQAKAKVLGQKFTLPSVVGERAEV